MGELSFLTPIGALVALTAVLPLAVYLRRERRARQVRRTLRLADPPPGPGRGLRAALVVVPILAGVAAAQPVLDRAKPRQERVDAEILFVFDTTSSMYASAEAKEPTRFDRARRIAKQIRAAVPQFRAGVASLTDRTLPHLFPTIDGSTFRSTLARSIAIERPPPSSYGRLATDLNGLAAVGEQGYFSPEARKRLLIVLTDGETERVKARLPVALRKARIRTILVHVWRANESIFLTSKPEPEYRPDPSSASTLAQFAAAVDGATFPEDEVGAVVERALAELGEGPVRARSQRDLLALMPYVTLAAALPLALVLRRRNL
ncbi:MAG: VWA domain-containing protein [Actinobacteria bacterium]|nr:VWA domain-containing protein [Actinomycetota bacterium]